MFSRRFKVLKLSGFDISIDASWFVIAILIVWSLAVAFFPSQYPNLGGSAYVGMAIVGALGFFLSIVLHEYCHSLVARHYGMPMKGITLWMLGGIAEMSDELPNPKSEFLMAGAGPLASMGIAAACFGLARLGEAQGWSVLVTGVLNYLWRINLVLIIFNLIPAFPLDGGRLLRAALWAWKGHMRWATRIASRIGGGFGVVLMVLGIFALFTGNPVGGIWYFIIGLFIRFAAQSSYVQLLIKGSLKDVSLSRFIKGDPIVVRSDETVANLVEDYFYKYQHRLFPVVGKDGRLVGRAESSAIREISRNEWDTKRVGDIMGPCNETNTIDAGTDAFSAMKQMKQSRSERLIVTDSDAVLGVVSLSDIMRFVSMRLDISPDFEDEEMPRKMPLFPTTRTKTT